MEVGKQELAVSTLTARQRNLRILAIVSSFKTARIEFRERVSELLTSPENRERLRGLPGTSESLLLVTCNRIEVYLATENLEKSVDAFFSLLRRRLGDFPGRYFTILEGEEAVKHAFEVAAGLDSIVLGEEQILGQIRGTAISERTKGYAKRILSALFDTALHVGERAREITGDPEMVSISSLAVKVASAKLGRKPRSILLIGSGKMARVALKELRGSRIFVATKRRSVRRDSRATLVSYAEMRSALKRCDLVISATTHRGFVLRKKDFGKVHNVVVIDIGFPRNIDPAVRNVQGVRLLDLDDLGGERHLARTIDREEMEQVSEWINENVARFAKTLVATRLTKALPSVYEWAEEVREVEVRRALRKLARLEVREKRIIEAMGRRVVSKLLAPPTRFVRSARDEEEQLRRINLMDEMFDVQN